MGSRKHNASYSKIPENTGLVLGQALLPPSVLCAPTPLTRSPLNKGKLVFFKILLKANPADGSFHAGEEQKEKPARIHITEM